MPPTTCQIQIYAKNSFIEFCLHFVYLLFEVAIVISDKIFNLKHKLSTAQHEFIWI